MTSNITSRIYNYNFENKNNIISHPLYQPSYKGLLPSFHFITDDISCPILDQGDIGSCVSNASYILFYILSNQKITLSRLQLYYVCRALDGFSSTNDSGTYVSTALKSIYQYGLCNESLWDYNTNNFHVLSPSECFCNTYSLKDYIYCEVIQDIANITNCISSGKPIIIGILIYSSFESNNANKTGLISMPNTQTEQLLGGHCMLIIGYDNITQYFKVQNSWGINWGDSGYAYIPYSYILSPTLTSDLFTCSFNI